MHLLLDFLARLAICDILAYLAHRLFAANTWPISARNQGIISMVILLWMLFGRHR